MPDAEGAVGEGARFTMSTRMIPRTQRGDAEVAAEPQHGR